MYLLLYDCRCFVSLHCGAMCWPEVCNCGILTVAFFGPNDLLLSYFVVVLVTSFFKFCRLLFYQKLPCVRG